MPNIGTVLKDEIRRLARREARATVRKLHASQVRMKARISGLQGQVEALERLTAPLKKAPLSVCAAEVKPEVLEKARVSSKTVSSTRRKLGLSLNDFGRLLGVTGNTVWSWEKKKGRLQLRDRAKAAFVGIRGIGVREARRRLELLN